MTKSETYFLNSEVTKHFDQQLFDKDYFSEEYAIQEYLSNYGVHGYITFMTRKNGGIQLRMSIDQDKKTDFRFKINQLNHNINHELNDQEVN